MYFTKRRSTEILLWLGAFLTISVINVSTELVEARHNGLPVVLWQSIVGEFSSVFMVTLLLPFIIAIDHRMPIASETWLRRLFIHIPLSMLFSLTHIFGMVAIRKVSYAMVDQVYEYGALEWLLFYEYRKDLAIYALILFALYLYRELSRLRLGEAQLAKAETPKADSASAPDNEHRILVSKSGIFHFIEPQDIQWVEAAGNYVELHTQEETYMLRGTMKSIDTRLGDVEFVRIHRSTILRRNLIQRVAPAMNGDKIVKLANGREFRLSRRYNKNLNQRGAQALSD